MSIYPDRNNDGHLTGRFRVEVMIDGKRKRGRAADLDAAKKMEGRFTSDLTSGDTSGAIERVDLRSGPKTLRQLLDKAAPMVWNGSAHGEDCKRKLAAIIAHFGDVQLVTVTTTFVDDCILWLRDEELAEGTINRYLAALHAILKFAVAREHLDKMPVFEWQEEDEGRIRSISYYEEAQLEELLQSYEQSDIADLVTTLIDTGCRRGEMLQAQPEQLTAAGLVLWGNQTKTKVSRVVPLTPRARAILERRLPWAVPKHSIRHYWDKAKDAMGLAEDADFVLHACRHTCATRLVESGVNLAVVQKYMGHKAITTTLRYAHVHDELLSLAATALARGPGSSEPLGGAENGAETAPRLGTSRRTR